MVLVQRLTKLFEREENESIKKMPVTWWYLWKEKFLLNLFSQSNRRKKKRIKMRDNILPRLNVHGVQHSTNRIYLHWLVAWCVTIDYFNFIPLFSSFFFASSLLRHCAPIFLHFYCHDENSMATDLRCIAFRKYFSFPLLPLLLQCGYNFICTNGSRLSWIKIVVQRKQTREKKSPLNTANN